MRSPSPDMSAVANLISKVLSEKSYYGYGSTQATVMALQAIVAYSKLTSRISENPQITFTLNETEAMADSSLFAVIQEGKNVFGIQYKEQGSAII